MFCFLLLLDQFDLSKWSDVYPPSVSSKTFNGRDTKLLLWCYGVAVNFSHELQSPSGSTEIIPQKKYIAKKRGGVDFLWQSFVVNNNMIIAPHQISVVKVTKCSQKTELCQQMFGSVLQIVMITLLYFRAMRLATKRSKNNVIHNSICCVCSKSSMTNTDKYRYRMEYRISF